MRKGAEIVVSAVVGAALGFGASTVLLNVQMAREANRERATELRKTIVHLKFIKDEFDVNLETLRKRDQLMPKIAVVTMKDNKDEILAQAPLLRVFDNLVSKDRQEVEARLKAVQSQPARVKGDTQSNAAEIAKAEYDLQMVGFLEAVLANIQHVQFRTVSPTRMQMAFSQAAHRTDVLFELPVDFVMSFRRLYDHMSEVNKALNELATLSKEGGTFDMVKRVFIPVPHEKQESAYWMQHLQTHLDALQQEDILRFTKRADELLETLSKELKAVD